MDPKKLTLFFADSNLRRLRLLRNYEHDVFTVETHCSVKSPRTLKISEGRIVERKVALPNMGEPTSSSLEFGHLSHLRTGGSIVQDS